MALRREPACDPVGIAEIAERLGKPRQTAARWNSRGLLPAPRWRVSGQPAWDWKVDIEPWARHTRRLAAERTDAPAST